MKVCRSPLCLALPLVVLTLAPIWAEDKPLPSASESKPFEPNRKSIDQRPIPEWFRDAKFGIWSHWGPDSVPGISNNYAHDLWKEGGSDYRWHVEHFGHPSKAGYKEVIESWKAEKFDPDALVAKYKAAGAKYIVGLATHHDNFDCFDSTYHEWNSVQHGPHKDIAGLWREAVLKAGLHFGLSSHADDRGWNYMYGARLADKNGPLAGVPYQGADPAWESLYNAPVSERDKPPTAWKEKWLKRHLELVDKYQPEYVFFDGGIPHGPYGLELVAHYLNANAKLNRGTVQGVINPPYLERGMATAMRDKPWEAVSSLSGWFYMNHNPKQDSHSSIKDTPTIVHTLIDVVSKNGNLLVNFPQRGDGSLYPECEKVLEELAQWMPINGEGIFGTRPWTTFGEGPSEIKAGGMNELMSPLTWQDIRYTTKGIVLYAFCLGHPQGDIRLTALKAEAAKIQRIELLGSPDRVVWRATPEAVIIQPFAKWPCDHAVTYKISF